MRDGKSKPCRKSWISELYPSYSLLITKFKIMINLTSILGPFIEDVSTRIDVFTWHLHSIAEFSQSTSLTQSFAE